MKKTIQIALAGMLAASSLSGVALAQSATTMAPMADDGVTVVRIDSLNVDGTRGQFEELELKATDSAGVQEAQAEVQADPALTSAISEQNVELTLVVDVETAANGGKIIYVR